MLYTSVDYRLAPIDFNLRSFYKTDKTTFLKIKYAHRSIYVNKMTCLWLVVTVTFIIKGGLRNLVLI